MKRNSMIAFKIPEELKKQIERLAKEDRRSVSTYCMMALEREVARSKKK